ncbi:MAG: hypothetical protein IPL23_10775 [Saprospiraceae bacterium]|nr:hypothetical protein [Saprospiraceae bacterium]
MNFLQLQICACQWSSRTSFGQRHHTFCLEKAHKNGAPINALGFKSGGYQEKSCRTNGMVVLIWKFCLIALMDARGKSAWLTDWFMGHNKVIERQMAPFLALKLQLGRRNPQGGCIVVVTNIAKRFPHLPAAGAPDEVNLSLGFVLDGNDNDSNCNDFRILKKVNFPTEEGANNIKVLEKGGLKLVRPFL